MSQRERTMTATIERGGKDIEVEVDIEWQGDEPDVDDAMGADGTFYELTDAERERIAEDAPGSPYEE